MIPAVLQQQADEAEELHRKMYPKPEEKPVETPATEAKPDEGQVQDGTPADEGTPPQEAPESAPVVEPPKVEPQVTQGQESAPDVSALQQQLTALQTAHEKLLKTHELLQNKYNLGKHNEEYRQALEARDTRIMALEEEISSLRATPPPALAPVQPLEGVKVEMTPAMQAKFEKLKADVGEDTANLLWEMQQEGIQQAAQSMYGDVGQEIIAVRQEMDSVRSVSKEQAGKDYIMDLTELCPDWRTIKADPGFLDYLKETDIASGRARGQLAFEGAEALDAERVAHFYNSYKVEIGLLPIKPMKPSGKPTSKKDKEALIAPASSSRGVVPETPKTYYTQIEIKKMEKDIIDLNRQNLLEKAKAIEAAMNDAIRERRIIP